MIQIRIHFVAALLRFNAFKVFPYLQIQYAQAQRTACCRKPACSNQTEGCETVAVACIGCGHTLKAITTFTATWRYEQSVNAHTLKHWHRSLEGTAS